eukprot:TRINITY_DN66112_c3_g1_i1.p2 TRINITY_DN66112_c3_g1~~TRINITY_DN66112_c3_g1_i1.p2  ORF type:complete len:157 (-),score=73.13 TRINITY_DN66112_c3_g1_i1:118-588(-)
MFRLLKSLRSMAAKDGLGRTVKRLRMLNGPSFANGELKGVDAHGNRYYERFDEEGPHHQINRERWVEYADLNDYDASSVSPEWQGWLHHIVKETPDEAPPVQPKYKLPHHKQEFSRFGERANYVPPHHYLNGDQVSQKSVYEPWKPSAAKQKDDEQ